MYNHKNGICFEKVTTDDLGFLLDLKKESWWGTHKFSLLNIEDQKAWFQSIPDTSLFLIGKFNNEKVGVAVYNNIDYISRSLDISGSVLKGFRGQISYLSFQAGVDFAFEMLNMNRLSAEVLETNIASLYIQKTIGFVVEGRKRRSVYKCGKYYDSIITGILREDWEIHTRVKSYSGICNLNFDMQIAQKSIKRNENSNFI